MRVIMRVNRWPGRVLATASLLSILSLSFPLRALGGQADKSQDGTTAAQTQQQQPPQTPPGQQPRTQPPNTRLDRERQEEHGTTNPAIPTEREKRNIPAPGTTPQAAPNAAGQQPPSQTQNQQVPPSAITQPVPLSPDVPDTRVGVDNNQPQNLSVHDAIGMALAKNLDIENFRQSVRIAQYNLFAARGVYDITSSSSINFR